MTNRFHGLQRALLVIVTTAATAVLAGEKPLVDLDAADLPSGPLSLWVNQGRLGGKFIAKSAKPPEVSEVAGRKAVVFKDNWLVSDFTTPRELGGASPFTLSVWAYTQRLHGKAVFVSWAARPDDCAEFGHGTSRREGAFAGWGKNAGFNALPAASQWHHYVYTYGEGALTVYIDGKPDSRWEFKLTTAAGEPFYLATAWEEPKNQACFPYFGAIASTRVWDRTFSLIEVRNLSGDFAPFDPQPANTEKVLSQASLLKWSAGDQRASRFQVLLSTDRAAVEREDRASVAGMVSTKDAPQFQTAALQPGKTYFWRVRQLDAAGKPLAAGEIWSFDVSVGPALDPQPPSGRAAVSSTLPHLEWTPGPYVKSQNLYFGSDPQQVAAAVKPTLAKLAATANSVPLPATTPLEFGRTYYWRVDQDNGALPPAKGPVWSFRTADKEVPGDLTFFFVSDTHYGMQPRGDELLPHLVDAMNNLPGNSYPAQLGGGVIRTPRGVIHGGDCTNDAAPEQWQAFTRDFGVNGEGRLAYPCYETFGNHDGGPKNPVCKGIFERNKQRVGNVRLSPNGMHYTWEWDGVRFIQLGVSVGATFHPYDPQQSFDFLAQELKGIDKDTPVFLIHHFGFDKSHSMGWWKEEDRTKYYDLIKDHNILGILHGHAHRPEIYTWSGIDIYHPPHMEASPVTSDPCSHGFFVFHLTHDRLVVAQRNVDGTWGLTADKAIKRPAASATP